MNANKNAPAFPAMHFDLTENERGMTLRDYFAAKAMQGFLSAGTTGTDYIPDLAYRYADAMMEARLQ